MLPKIIACLALLTVLAVSAPVAHADELTEIIQTDLVALGYEPGEVSGEMTTATIVAISKFQAENNLEVTGAPTPQLAGVIKSKLSPKSNPGAAAPAAQDPAALQAAQQTCLQEKIATAQASQKKKRGIGSLMRAVSRTASVIGGGSTTQKIAQTSADVYAANATAADLQSAAKDLGLTESDLEDCRNPSM